MVVTKEEKVHKAKLNYQSSLIFKTLVIMVAIYVPFNRVNGGVKGARRYG